MAHSVASTGASAGGGDAQQQMAADVCVLQGLAFLSGSSHGHQAAFLYPTEATGCSEGAGGTGGAGGAGGAAEVGESDDEGAASDGWSDSDSGGGDSDEDAGGLGGGGRAASGGIMGEELQGEFFGFRPKFLALMLTPPNLVSSYFEVGVSGRVFLSRPTLCTDGGELTSFTVALVLDGRAAQRVPWILPAFRRMLDRVVVGLAHEQERDAFLAKELVLINRTRQEAKARGDSAAEVTQRLINVSELALILSSMYDHFARVNIDQLEGATFGWWRTLRQPLNIRVNAWLELNLALSIDPLDGVPGPRTTVASGDDGSEGTSGGGGPSNAAVVTGLRECRPWHSLLLLDSGSSITARLPQDASPALRSLLLAASPLVSFEDLMVELGIPLVTLYKLSLHLQHWGWARITAKISESTLFTRNWERELDMGKMDSSSELMSLCLQLLAPFDTPRRVRDVERIEDVLWLLKYELVVQVSTYFYLVVPRGSTLYVGSEGVALGGASSSSSGGGGSGSGGGGASGGEAGEADDNGGGGGGGGGAERSRAQAQLQDHEAAWLAEQPASRQKSLFTRLCRYFRGQHCIEEIMWRESLSRRTIMGVAEMFSEVVVTRLIPYKKRASV